MVVQRLFLAALFGLAGHAALADVSYSSNGGPISNPSPVVLDGHISYGQSWRSNTFGSAVQGLGIDSFATGPAAGAPGVPFAFPYAAPLALYLSTRGPGLGSGAAPNGLGINLPVPPTGVTTYVPSDVFSLGRAAIMAQQLLRMSRDTATSLAPILEFCTAFSGSTWNSGIGGGLSPGASINASIAGQVLTVNSVASGSVNPGQELVGAGVNSAVSIGQQISGTPNGVGTYNTQILISATEATFTATGAGGAEFTGTINFGTLTVDNVISGALSIGQVVTTGSFQGFPVGTVIQTQISGSTGGVGTYTLALPQTVSSESMSANGVSWANQGIILNSLENGGIFPSAKYSKLTISSVGYTQGASADDTEAGKVADLAAMYAAYDALGLPSNGKPINFYLGLPAATSNGVQFSNSYLGTYDFARTNAPGAGGPYSGRTYFTSPSYPWPFGGADNIHTGDYGTARWGEVEGYVRWLVQDHGVTWTPLWRTLGTTPVLSGQTITLAYSRPAGPDFTSSCLTWLSSPLDGIQTWPNEGFNVVRNGQFLTVTPTIVDCTNVQLAISEPLNSGDSLEVSYAYRGPGGPNPGSYTGVGGNLAMTGPPSVLFPGKTINAWAPDSVETIVVP